ncbi:MAG: TonB-dependent receptor, partial [Bacteroidota bacterium]
DPSRLVMVFPGVQASQDNNSDIIIRSNSPTGLLWRLEGIDIPNPNHFARKGSSGGGISVFSAQLLGNSDFSTGAFSANYGNALAGVFDMQCRPGNSRERSFRFKFGLLGTDLAAEGPIKRQSNSGDGGYSSYLVNYRYSTLGILNDLGFRLVGPRIDNNFQDLSFNLSFKSKDLNSTFTVFGIGGISEELWDPVKDSLTWSRPYRESRVYTSNMGAVGATFTHLIDEKSFLKAAVAVMGDRVTDNDDTLDIRSVMLSPAPDRLEEPTDWTALATARYETEEYQNFRISSHVFYQRQLGDQTVLKTGVIGTHMQFNFSHERRIRDSGAFERIVAGEGASQLLQAYAQIKAKPTTRLTLSGGIHSLFLALNNTYSVEPRLAMQYQLDETSALTLSYGLHGQVIPLGSYFTEVLDSNGNLTQPNLDLQPAKAHHLVMGWKKGFEDNLFITVEGYYQRLFDMP